jgi:RHS repeat-associated protein
MRSAPAPDLLPIPGMNQGTAVAGGGGGSGDGDGSAGDGGDGEGANGGKDGADATGGENGAAGCGDPVCPITGKMFLDVQDFGFGGPMELRWIRHYNSRASGRTGDLGYGWAHPFGWTIELRRRSAIVTDDKARAQDFDAPPLSGLPVRNNFGWALSREPEGLTLRMPEGKRYIFGPDIGGGIHCLVAVADRNDNRITLQRDDRGTLVGMVDSAGRAYRIATDGEKRITCIRIACDAASSQWMTVADYAYDEAGNLVSFTDAEQHLWQYRYVGHLMIEHRTACGLSYCYRYDGTDAKARVLETWGEYIGAEDPALETPLPVRPKGRDNRKVKGINYVKLSYFAKARYSEAENGRGAVERFFGDPSGRIVKHVTRSGAVIERAFDPASGEVEGYSAVDGTQHKIPHTPDGTASAYYGPLRAMARFREEDGTVVEFDSNGLRTEMRFDQKRNILFVKNGDGTVEEFTYDSRGLQTSYKDRWGGLTQYDHDAQGCCVRVRYPDGGVEINEFDYLGRRISCVDPYGAKTEWRYDRRSEIVWKRIADGSVSTITRGPLLDMPLEFYNAGKVIKYEYGGLGWVTRVTQPDGSIWAFKYDTEQNLVLVNNPRGQVSRQSFDLDDRWIGCETFEGLRFGVGRAPDGAIKYCENPLGRDVIERDAAGRLVAAEMSDGQQIALKYDHSAASMIDNGIIKLELQHDLLGRVTSDKQGAIELKPLWRGGELVGIASNVGLPVTFGRDPNCEIRQITAGPVDVKLNEPSGSDRLHFLGDGLVLRQRIGPTSLLMHQALARYDARAGLPPDVLATSADPKLLAWVNYEYSPSRALTLESRSDGRVIEYELDAADRVVLKRTRLRGQVVDEERIRYDAAGSPLVSGASYDAWMRPSAFRGETFEYDVGGRLAKRSTDKGSWSYEWDAHGNLVRVVAPDHVVELAYDGRGRRVRKRVLRQGELVRSTSYAWTEQTVLYELDDVSGASRTYLRPNEVWQPYGHVDQRGSATEACFYVLDPIGAPSFAVDARGKVVWDAERTTFGDTRVTVNDVPVTARFPNQWYDEDVGLTYNRMRWYDPRLGMFVSTDPLLLEGNLNPRDYAPNPLMFIDPMGEMSTAGGGQTGQPMSGDKPSTGDTWPPAVPPGPYATPGTAAQPGYVPCPTVDPTTGKGSGLLNATSFDQQKYANAKGQTVQQQIDAAGKKWGCHTCGSRSGDGNFGKPGGHFVADHQPPATTYNGSKERGQQLSPAGKAKAVAANTVLRPQCTKCSDKQGGAMSHMTDKDNAALLKEVGDYNKANNPTK